MSYVKLAILHQRIIHMHSCLFVFPLWLHFSLHSFLEIIIIIIVTKEKDHTLRHPYQMRAKAKIMSEIEEVQEQMKANMEAMKEQMTTMMEAMMSMRKMMDDNTATVVATSTATKIDLIHLTGFNIVNLPVSDVVGQGGEAAKNACGPHHVQVQSKHSFPPYGLPPSYTPPTIVYTSGENISNSAPVLIENQQPQFDHAHVSQPMGKHMKFPKTILWLGLGFIQDIPLKGRHFLASLC